MNKPPPPAPAEHEVRGWRRPERVGERLMAGGVLVLLAAAVAGALLCVAGLVALGR